MFDETYSLMDKSIKNEIKFDLIVLVTNSFIDHIVVSDGFNHIEAYPNLRENK